MLNIYTHNTGLMFEPPALDESDIETQPIPDPTNHLRMGTSFIVEEGIVNVTEENQHVNWSRQNELEMTETVQVAHGTFFVLDRDINTDTNCKRVNFIITARRFYEFLKVEMPEERLVSEIAEDLFKFSDMIWRGRLRPKVYNTRFSWASFAYKYDDNMFVFQRKY